MERLVRGSWVLVLLALTSACAARHPVDSLRREAKRYDRKTARESPTSESDERYLVPLSDAISATSTFLAQTAPVIEVSATQVGTDWTYGGAVGVDPTSEYFDQRRERSVVSLSQAGPEIIVSGSSVVGSRRIRPGGKSGAWDESQGQASIGSLRRNLDQLESSHLTQLHAKGSTTKLLGDFEASLPEGFEVTSKTADTLVAVRTTTSTKEKERKGFSATWERRDTLTVVVPKGDDALQVTLATEHRFSTESSEGSWEPAESMGRALPVDWLVATARRGIPARRMEFGPAQLASTESRRPQFSQPPPPPRLRTMKEIEEVVTLRAYQSATGNFTVCLDTILVNPKDPNGFDWDIPGATETLNLASGAASAVSALNQFGDAYPPVGMLMDSGLMFVSEGSIDRKRAETIARFTREFSELGKQILPVGPDVAGQVNLAGNLYNLPSSENRVRVDPNQCVTTTFKRNSPTAMALSVWDVDLSYNDPIGSCTIPLSAIVNQGISGVPCGYSRVFASAVFNFSFDQIDVVGLPPAE